MAPRPIRSATAQNGCMALPQSFFQEDCVFQPFGVMVAGQNFRPFSQSSCIDQGITQPPVALMPEPCPLDSYLLVYGYQKGSSLFTVGN